MAQKTLNAFVVLSGRVDNTFGQIGTTLISMGQTIDQISSKLINFGKESIEVYRGYQDSMLDAEVALSTTYGRGSRELASVMKTLDAQLKLIVKGETSGAVKEFAPSSRATDRNIEYDNVRNMYIVTLDDIMDRRMDVCGEQQRGRR